MILENYLTLLNEGLFWAKNLYCSILEYKEFGFEKILYIGPVDSSKFSKMFVIGSNTFAFPFTNPNFKDFLNRKETTVPIFNISFGKFSSRQLAKKLKYLKILDNGFVDYKTPLLEIPSFLNFRGMKTFRRETVIQVEFNPATYLCVLKIKGRKKL